MLGANSHFLRKKAGQAGNSQGMLRGKGALGIHNMGKYAGKLFQIVNAYILGRIAFELLLQIVLDSMRFQTAPEALAAGDFVKYLHQLWLKIFAATAGNCCANGILVFQNASVGIVGNCQGIDAVGQ